MAGKENEVDERRVEKDETRVEKKLDEDELEKDAGEAGENISCLLLLLLYWNLYSARIQLK